MAVCSEGIADSTGKHRAEYVREAVASDAFGHKQVGGVGAWLAGKVKAGLGAKTRAIEFSLLQRCAAHSASQTDVTEAFEAGRQAVLAAVSGQSGKMVAMKRAEGSDYAITHELVDLTLIPNS